jgi:hypothetical protein
VLTGHDEYWSLAMRAALLRARDSGVNLAFLGANSGYRHIACHDQGTGGLPQPWDHRGRCRVCI